MHRKEVLENGLRVVMERIPACKSVTLGLWVNVGSRDEAPGEGGLSHFLEHMFFKG
ncbi:MAG: insulinase family protein, partial [Nitrospirales bacterium]